MKKNHSQKRNPKYENKRKQKDEINLDEIVIITSVKSTNVYSVTSEPKHGNDCF